MSEQRKIAVITDGSSDLLEIMLNAEPRLQVLKREEVATADLDSFDAFAIIGGTSDKPMLFSPNERIRIENQIQQGKKVFAEYVASIGHVYSELPSSTQFRRLVFCSDQVEIEGLSVGMLIEDQCGMRIRPHDIACTPNTPILQYTTVHAHDQIEITDDFRQHISDRALWFEQPDNLLVCSFRMCNFIKARFAPRERALNIVSFILEWLFERKVELDDLQYAYTTGEVNKKETLDVQIGRSVEQAMRWFERSGTLCDEGKAGVREGLGTEIYPDGSQKVNSLRRADCIGEVSLVYFMQYLWKQDERSLLISDQLNQFMFDYYVCKEPGDLYGMMRWTEEAWGVCYQDDVARALIPQLLKCSYLNKTDYLQESFDVLQFLVNTTGSDGTRVARTENFKLTPEELHRLRTEPGNFPSAHYNAYYYAALLLAYKLGGSESFLRTAVRGLESILAVYPETIREQSETQEYCRLILPLSWAYWVTGEERFKQWLYRVTEDLQQFKHPSGAYVEWDTGYKASMRNEVGEGECSLLAKNGDPVVDLLYSNNWLPMAFMQAYLVTKDETFLTLWQENASFMISAQLHSDNPQLHGAWARAFDVNFQEVYGSPADFGWGPWAIESGWTVAEITAGLTMGLLKEKLLEYYR